VKKVSKAILIGLAVVLALVAALIVGLNLYIQSPGAQARIQEELSKALRLPLKITNTSVTPWSDLRITGISIPNGDANFLEAASFSASYRLLPLLDGKLIITEMRVENPKVVWRQSPEGKWKLPEPEEAAKEAREESKAAATEPETPPSPTETPAVEKVARKEKSKPAKEKNFAVIINRFEVKNGAFDLLDKDLQHVATFSDVNMTYTKLTAEQVEGTAIIGKAMWADGLTLENVTTPFSYVHASRELSLPDIAATLAGGTVRGRYAQHAESERTLFTSTAKFERVDLDRLFAQTGGQAGQASGQLDGNFDIKGENERKEKLTGTGKLTLRDGRFRQLGFFQTIGEIFNIRSLTDFRVREGEAEVRFRGDKIAIERVVLAAADLGVSAKGMIHLDKQVNLEARLSAEDGLLQSIPSMFTENFVRAEDGRRAIDFKITGTTDKLKTDLVERMKSQTINNQLGGLLSLFGADKKDDDKKKKEEEEKKKAEKKEKKKRDKDKDKGAAPQNEAPPAAGAVPAPAPTPNP
jgi:type II secretion system protein N